MASIRNRLHPFHDISEHAQLSLYSLDGTGLAGQLVKINTGTANPQWNAVDGFSNTANGVSYNGTYSNRYQTNWKVTPTVSGDTRRAAVGVTLYSTQETDENGFPLKFSQERAKQIKAVISGETIPVATQGMIGVWGNFIDQSLGSPQPGNLVVVSRSGNGLLAAISPASANFSQSGVVPSTTAAFTYTDAHVVGKWLSSLPTATNTGMAQDFAAQGGYAFLQLNCTL